MMAGWDPVLDGTAAPYVEFKLSILTDVDSSRTYEVKFPDEEVGLYGTYEAMAHAVGSWIKEHPDG